MKHCNPNSVQSSISLQSNCSCWLYAVALFHIVKLEIIYASDVRKWQMHQISSVVSGLVECSFWQFRVLVCISETLSGRTNSFISFCTLSSVTDLFAFLQEQPMCLNMYNRNTFNALAKLLLISSLLLKLPFHKTTYCINYWLYFQRHVYPH